MFKQTTHWSEVQNNGCLTSCQFMQLRFTHFQIYLDFKTYSDTFSCSIYLSLIYKYLDMGCALELQLCTVHNSATLPVIYSLISIFIVASPHKSANITVFKHYSEYAQRMLYCKAWIIISARNTKKKTHSKIKVWEQLQWKDNLFWDFSDGANWLRYGHKFINCNATAKD